MGRTMVLTEKSTALQRPWIVRSELETEGVAFIERSAGLGSGLSTGVEVGSRSDR